MSTCMLAMSCAVILALGETAASAQPVSVGEHAGPAARATSVRPATLGEIGRRIQAARPGETIHVPPGVYREHLIIDKTITLVGGPGVVLDGGGSGDIVEIVAPGVTLRGFTIRNTGADLDKENAAIRLAAPRGTIESNTLEDVLFGIDLREAPDSRVANNRIGGKALDIARRGDGLRLWRSDRAVVEGNVIHDGRDCILWYSKGVSVRGNRGFDCRYGLHLMFSDDVMIEDNEFTRNSVGIYLMYGSGLTLRGNRLVSNRGPSGYGIGLKEADRYTIEGNIFMGNRSAVYLDGSPFTRAEPGVFRGNTFAYNDAGCTILPSARGNLFAGNNFIDNIDQVVVAARGAIDGNQFWDGDRGNFWSDYTGYDQNGDGIGDFVHESQTLFENLMDTEPRLRLFLFSPAQRAIEFVGRALPAVRPEPKFTDEVPLMRPVPVRPDPRGTDAATVPIAAIGLTLLGLAAGIIGVAGANTGAVLPALWRSSSGGAR